MKKLLKNKNLWLLVATIVVAIAMTLVYVFAFMPKGVKGEKSVTLKIEYAENSYEYSLSTDKETVLELLKEYDDIYDLELVTEDGEYGAFITSMKGVEQNKEKAYYYSYTLNDGYASGISTQTINDGDVLVFKYSYTQYDKDWNIISDTLMGKGATADYVKTAIVIFSIVGVLLVAGISYFVVSLVNKKRRENV